LTIDDANAGHIRAHHSLKVLLDLKDGHRFALQGLTSVHGLEVNLWFSEEDLAGVQPGHLLRLLCGGLADDGNESKNESEVSHDFLGVVVERVATGNGQRP
jgi:hypothetical protein